MFTIHQREIKMKKWLILLLVALIATPAFADRQRLRGPSSRHRRVIRVHTRHHHYVGHNRCDRSYHFRRHYRRFDNVRRIPRRAAVIIRPVRLSVPRATPRLRIAPMSQHRTIIISPRPRISPYRMKTRKQIIAKSKAKARSYVYKKGERKR